MTTRLLCILGVAGAAWLGIVNPAQADPISSKCGPWCHVPMAWQGGDGPMAWQGLGPRTGNFEQMRVRLSVPPGQDIQWAQFREMVEQNPQDVVRRQEMLKLFHVLRYHR